MFKSSNSLESRSNLGEIVASLVIDILALPVLHTHAKGTCVMPSAFNDKDVIKKNNRSHHVHSEILWYVRHGYLKEVSAYGVDKNELSQLRKLLRNKPKNQSITVKNFVDSFGGILVLDAILGNNDRGGKEGKNCRLVRNGTWIAFDNELMLPHLSPSYLLEKNPAMKYLKYHIPEASKLKVRRDGLVQMHKLLATLSHKEFAKRLKQELRSDVLLQHYEHQAYSREEVDKFIAPYQLNVLGEKNLIEEAKSNQFWLSDLFTRYVENRFIEAQRYICMFAVSNSAVPNSKCA